MHAQTQSDNNLYLKISISRHDLDMTLLKGKNSS